MVRSGIPAEYGEVLRALTKLPRHSAW
jgi:hypothetical protein